MPRIKSFNPNVLRQQAQRKTRRSQQMQEAYESRLKDPQPTAKVDGDEKDKRKDREAEQVLVARSKGDTFSD